ncbi:hypothetical protein Ahy_A05g024901 [Arachis hypogaea]|uniref:Protein FAR1-RELATED SEQUENCE n=1 Tax=Arachis hypogaea TaxID=3818 RepID=A0A445D700_ARAHY|nr:hypothetical protein Ahy_A05g024901 [Arachis hypogaea]
MAFSTPEGGSISALINPTQGDEQFNVGELDIQKQEGSLVNEITDVVVTRKDELDDGHELPDHSGIGKEKIPVVGMSFGSLPLAQKIYANYAKKVGFITKIKNTNFDKTRKESKIPVNQSIYYTREGYRESRVNAATRANRITAPRCRARMYVVLDKENKCWVVFRLELRHSHPCSAKKVVHYHEYRELTMHAKYEQKELEDDAADSKGVIPCIGSTGIERQLQQENTSSIFRTLQLEVRKKTDCVVRSIEQKEDTISITMDEQKVFWGKPVYHTLRVDFELLSRKGQCECNKFESAELTQYRTAMFFFDGIRMSSASTLTSRVAMTWLEVMKATTCSGIYVQSFITLQEFVACDEEAAILRAALWDAKSKLTDYRASMRSTTIVASQNTVPTQSTGDEVDLPSDNDHHGSLNKRFEDSAVWNSSDGGGFMHLLNSFRQI